MLFAYALNVGPTPVHVNEPSESHRPDRIWIRVVEPKESDLVEIWLGPKDVTPETGFYLDRSDPPIGVRLTPDEELWAVAEAGANTVEIRVLLSVV